MTRYDYRGAGCCAEVAHRSTVGKPARCHRPVPVLRWRFCADAGRCSTRLAEKTCYLHVTARRITGERRDRPASAATPGAYNVEQATTASCDGIPMITHRHHLEQAVLFRSYMEFTHRERQVLTDFALGLRTPARTFRLEPPQCQDIFVSVPSFGVAPDCEISTAGIHLSHYTTPAVRFLLPLASGRHSVPDFRLAQLPQIHRQIAARTPGEVPPSTVTGSRLAFRLVRLLTCSQFISVPEMQFGGV